jgi:hypothetical protein
MTLSLLLLLRDNISGSAFSGELITTIISQWTAGRVQFHNDSSAPVMPGSQNAGMITVKQSFSEGASAM